MHTLFYMKIWPALFCIVLLFLSLAIRVPRVSADICYPSRSYSSWRCQPVSNTPCLEWYSEVRFAGVNCGRSSFDPTSAGRDKAYNSCMADCQSVYGGQCSVGVCLQWGSGSTYECQLENSRLVPCNPEPSCDAQITAVQCSSEYDACDPNDTTTQTLYCWGPEPPSGTPAPSVMPTTTPGPTLPPWATPSPTIPPWVTPTPTIPPWATPTPTFPPGFTPTPSLPPGVTPTPTPGTVTIQARAKVVSVGDTSCAAVAASTTYATPTQLDLSPAVAPGVQTQTGSSYVTWNNVPLGTYTLLPSAPINYSLVAPCWVRSAAIPNFGQGMAAALTIGGETFAWDLGYILGTAWVQTGGGDVYASGALASSIPAGITPRVFSLDGTGGTPGIVTYGVAYDFDSDTASLGETFVSSRNWLTQETYLSTDFYQTFFRRFGSPPTDDNGLFPNLSAVAKPASRFQPYYVSGDMRTTGDWNIGDGEQIIFLVNGNLTIGGNINLTGPLQRAFISFIVNGDIIVDPSVGRAFNSTVPNVEGVYITSPAGTFRTGQTTGAASARLVGRGMFVAGNFALERDLDSVGHNIDYSAELFTYNPTFLVTMPQEMMDLYYHWQEVEP